MNSVSAMTMNMNSTKGMSCMVKYFTYVPLGDQINAVLCIIVYNTYKYSQPNDILCLYLYISYSLCSLLS